MKGKPFRFQESTTGLVSGVEEFIRANAPVAVNMPPASYDEYFAGPWATEREHEAKHRELTKSIGESLRGRSFDSKYCYQFKVYFDTFTLFL